MFKKIFCLALMITTVQFCQAEESSFLFLNYEQFQNLTLSEQKIYIQEIQKITVQFEEKMSEKSDLQSKWSRLLENIFFQEATADEFIDMTTYGSNRTHSNDLDTELSRLDYSSLMLGRLIKSVEDKPSSIIRKDSANQLFSETYERLYNLKNKTMSNENYKVYSSIVQNMKSYYQDLTTLDATLKSKSSEYNNFFSQVEKQAARTPTSNSTKKIKVATDEKKKVETQKTNKPATFIKSEIVESNKARCIYSGFVIKTKKCEPLYELPDSLRLKELSQDKDKFKCKNKGEILCNPLVFGFENSETPYCVTRSSTASKKCQEISNNKDNKDRLVKAWKNSDNKKIFEDFQKDLQGLCSRTDNKKDVVDTCQVVIAQFNKTIKSEFPASVQTQSTPAKTTPDKPSRKN